MTENVSHPYFPRDQEIPHYIANINSRLELLGIFFTFIAFAMAFTWLKTSRRSTGVRVQICWFVACGFIHTILEGYFSVFHATLAGESTYLAQMWKEYGMADSRYITSDPFTVMMETITAFIDGPLCFLTAASFTTDALFPYRYVLQLIVSLCQLYGDSLYLLTETMEGFKHSDAYHPIHFWFYFVFLNSFWIIIPLICITQSVVKLSAVQCLADGAVTRKTSSKKRK